MLFRRELRLSRLRDFRAHGFDLHLPHRSSHRRGVVRAVASATSFDIKLLRIGALLWQRSAFLTASREEKNELERNEKGGSQPHLLVDHPSVVAQASSLCSFPPKAHRLQACASGKGFSDCGLAHPIRAAGNLRTSSQRIAVISSARASSASETLRSASGRNHTGASRIVSSRYRGKMCQWT